MSRNVIQDGYTREGYIEASDRLNDELSFSYRPMFGGEPGYFTSQAFRLLDSAHQAAEEAKSITKHLVSWSECDAKGAPLPITTDNVFRLPVLVRQNLLNIIAGFVASDLRPNAKITPEKDEEIERLLQAHQTGKTIGDVATEADAKN